MKYYERTTKYGFSIKIMRVCSFGRDHLAWRFIFPIGGEYDRADYITDRSDLLREENGHVSHQQIMCTWIKETFPKYKSISCQVPIPPSVQKMYILKTHISSRGQVYTTCWLTGTDYGRTVMPRYN